MCTFNRIQVLAIICSQMCLKSLLATNCGFDQLFTSNRHEYEKKAIKFDRPVPAWLRGTLVRNGIGQLENGDRSFTHAFDGFGKLVSFEIENSYTVLFSTKFIQSRFYKDSMEGNTIAPYVILDSTKPEFGFLESLAAVVNGVDNTNVNIYSVGSELNDAQDTELLAVSDFWPSYKINASSLATLQHVNPTLPVERLASQLVPLPSTSHPVREYNTSNRIGFVSHLGPFNPSVDVIRIISSSRRELITSIAVKQVPYMHSIAVSKNYAILMADPLHVNINKLTKSVRPLDALDWSPASQTTLYVVHLKTAELTTIQCPARVHMHHINSYESKHSLIVDYVAYPDIDFLKNMKLEYLRDNNRINKIRPHNEIIRYNIDMKNKKLRAHTEFASRRNRSFTNRLDFPTINEAYRHRKHCYVYGVVLMMDRVNLANTSLVKKDMCNGRDKFWALANHFASEAIFVQDRSSLEEDDGVLLSVVFNGNKNLSYFAVFDAKTMKIAAKAKLPDFIPFTLHGEFINKAARSHFSDVHSSKASTATVKNTPVKGHIGDNTGANDMNSGKKQSLTDYSYAFLFCLFIIINIK